MNTSLLLFDTDSYLGEDNGRLIVDMTAGAEPGSELAGLVSYRKTTHAENTAERRSLEKAGFTVEGVIRAAEFRAGQWCDGYLYSRLRIDPDPLEG